MNKINSLFTEYKKIKMTPEEQDISWELISARTFLTTPDKAFESFEKSPVRKLIPSRLYYGGWQLLTKTKNLPKEKKRYVSTTITSALIFSGVASAFAGVALPGDFLYPLKTKLNEKTQVVLAGTAERQASLEAILATRRLEEIEELAIEGKLNEKLLKKSDEAFHAHVGKFQTHLTELSNKKKYDAVLEAGQSLETKVAVHAAILKDMEVDRKILTSSTSSRINLLKRKRVQEKIVATHLENKVLPAIIPTALMTQQARNLSSSTTLVTNDKAGTVVLVAIASSTNPATLSTSSVMVTVDTKKAKQYLEKLHKTIGTPKPITVDGSTNDIVPVFVP